MKSKRGTVWINLGLLLLAAALFLTVYNRMASYEAGETSRQVIEQLCETLPTESAAETEAPAIPEYLLDAGREMPVQTIGGKDYIGVLTIPSLELELPVISQWDYAALKVAPCRYSGSLYQNNLIICAHNFATHFGKLKNLRVGDIAIFTDMEENAVTFQMVERETLEPTDLEGMEAGEADPVTPALETIRVQIAGLQHQQESICEYLEKGVYTIDMFTKRNTSLSKEIKQLQLAEADLIRQQNEKNQKEQQVAQIIPTTQHILESYPLLEIEEKNRMWKLVMKKATVYRSPDDKLEVNIYPNLPK